MAPRIVAYVYASDLERLRRFYEGGLGVKPGRRERNWVEFPLGGSTFALHQFDPSRHGDTAPFQLNFVVDDLRKAVARFRRQGAPLVRGVADEAYGKSALLQDPDGRQITLVQLGA